MGANKSSIIGIVIAIIIGTAGLGLGTYTIVQDMITEGAQGPPGEDGTDGIDGIDGINGTDGNDAPGYYCASALEVQQALDSIGNGQGKITITNDITLNGEINIIGGGTYIIQGQTSAITINSGGNWGSFNISNTLTCTIQNLKLNASGVTTPFLAIILIEEINDNPVYIDNVQFLGDPFKFSVGISIYSDNVRIKNCYFNEIRQAIYQPAGFGNKADISDNIIYGIYLDAFDVRGNYNYISGNQFNSCDSSPIHIENGEFNTITDNLITNSFYGIQIKFSHNNIITGNRISSITAQNGIELISSNDNIVSENIIMDTLIYGIYLIGSWSCIISDNRISYASTGIHSAISSYVSIKDNIISNQYIYGINSHSNYSVISGNIVRDITFNTASNISAILIDGAYSTVTGNAAFSCTNSGSGVGIGIWIGLSAEYCVVDGNIAYNNDDNWFDQGTNTMGDDTNNQFS